MEHFGAIWNPFQFNWTCDEQLYVLYMCFVCMGGACIGPYEPLGVCVCACVCVISHDRSVVTVL